MHPPASTPPSTPPSSPTAQPKPSLRRSLYLQVIVAIVTGILLGHFFPGAAVAMKPLGDGFIKLVKMLIAPLIFCTVVLGIAGMEDLRKVGRTGGLALLYFEGVSTVALLVGLGVVNVVRPGSGMHVHLASLNPEAVAQYAAPGRLGTATEFLLHLIPDTVVGAFTSGEILQVLLFAALFGFALQRLGGRGTPLFGLIEQTNRVLFAVVGLIMTLAPLGAFGAMAFTIGKYGASSLLPLARLMGCFYATCLLFIFGVLGAVARLHGFSVWRFVRYLREELLIVLGTSSSEAALPGLLAKLENLGVRRSTVGLVVPTGYSFNLDGTAIYLTMAAVFIAQATDTPLDLRHQLTLLAVLLLTSKGAAGVTGSGFIVLAATLSSVGNLPVAGLALILGVDRFMSEARALTNLVGNGVATVVVAVWCGEVDLARLRWCLAHRTESAADEPEALLTENPAPAPGVS